MFGRRGREGWLRFTVLSEIFLSLACSDIAHDRSPFTIKEPFWACKLTTKTKAATCMTNYEWTVSCVAITQPCLWLREIPSSFCQPRNEAKKQRNMQMSVLIWRNQFFGLQKNQKRNDLQIFRVQEISCDILQ